MSEHESDRIRALEAKVAALEEALQAQAEAPEITAMKQRDVTRRKLLWGAGAAAVATTGVVFGAPSPASAATPATDVTVTPTGTISSTNAQAALAELDTEKVPTTGAKTIWDRTVVADAQFLFRPWTDIRATGAQGNGTADDTQAIKDAITWAKGLGGGTVFIPTGRYGFSGKIEVPAGVDLWGCGGHNEPGSPQQHGSKLVALGPNARLVIKGRGGITGNFWVDGVSNGTRHPVPDGTTTKGFVFLDHITQRTISMLRVTGSGTDGVIAEGIQNCLFEQCMFADHSRHSLVLDNWCFSSLFSRCEISNSGGDNVLMRGHRHTDYAGEVLTPPNYNTFIRCAFERGLYPNGASNSQLNVVNGGSFNVFVHCGFTADAIYQHQTNALVHLPSGTTTFDNCDFVGNEAGHSAIKVTSPGGWSSRDGTSSARRSG